MSTPLINVKLDCGCIRDNLDTSSGPCCDCGPKMVLTYEEESILEKLRSIKAKVRPLAENLKDIESCRFENTDPDPTLIEGQWQRLSSELEQLRSSWKEWEEKLENAVERKLIFLGHREPRV